MNQPKNGVKRHLSNSLNFSGEPSPVVRGTSSALTSPGPSSSGLLFGSPSPKKNKSHVLVKKQWTEEELLDALQNSDREEDLNSDSESSPVECTDENEEGDDDEEEAGDVDFFPNATPSIAVTTVMSASPPAIPSPGSQVSQNHGAAVVDAPPAAAGQPSISTWCQNAHPSAQIPFSGNSGLKIIPQGNKPQDYFYLLFSDQIFDLIWQQTNLQAQNLSSKNVSPKARINGWKDINRDDFEVFLGLLYLSGHIHVPSFAHYWMKNSVYNFPLFRNAMGRDKFLLILRTLHFARNPQQGEPKPSDPLFKINPLVELFHQRMSDIYYPSKELSIYESMLLWRGRLFFRQYIQNKRHKYGIKLYMLTQPNGLLLKFRIYCGSADKVVGGIGHAEKVVKHLIKDHLDVGHAIYMDNYYSGVGLTAYCLDRKTYVTGTLKANRKGNPSDIVQKKLKPGNVEATYSNNGICVLKWRDKRDVLIVSSEFGARMSEHKSRSGKVTQKPEAVLKYNEFMGGVDRCDQLLAYYPCERKTLRWYAKVGVHIFHVILNNAFILYNIFSNNEKLTLLQFRDSVIQSLIYQHRPPLESWAENPKSKNIHVPREVPRNEKNRKIRKRCVICKNANMRIESNYVKMQTCEWSRTITAIYVQGNQDYALKAVLNDFMVINERLY
ncbi:piggyBac transposable element-derived protein 4-like isoform X2 [Ischnura elegans]|nr:piggyBac transposable element-derived protein 4-like isoform X2 [Ischnura elegans]